MSSGYATLEFTDTFLDTFASNKFTAADRAALRKALGLLDTNERHPSLRVHRLLGDKQGAWSASAPDVLRITFARLADGRRQLLTCSRHWQR